MKTWMKAGLIGGIVLSLITIFGFFSYILPPAIGAIIDWIKCCSFLLLYPAPGILAGYYMPNDSLPSNGAKFGALAGLSAAIIDSFVSIVARMALAFIGDQNLIFRAYSPEQLEFVQDSLFSFLLTPQGLMGFLVFNSLLFLPVATGASALSGFIYISIKNKNQAEND